MSTDNVFEESPEIMAQLEHEGIDLAAIEIEPIPQSRKDQDLALWKKWNQTKSKSDLSALLKSLKGVIQKEVNRASGSLPVAVLDAKIAAHVDCSGCSRKPLAASPASRRWREADVARRIDVITMVLQVGVTVFDPGQPGLVARRHTAPRRVRSTWRP